jgi:hypothetical protein
MSKGFAYRNIIKGANSDLSNLESLIVGFADNFRDLQTHINGYLIGKDTDGETVAITNLIVAGDSLFSEGIKFDGGPEHCHVYRGSVQAVGAGSWVEIEFGSVQGSPGAVFAADAANFAIDHSAAGIFLVQAQVRFDAVESGYIRLLNDGAEFARASFNSRLNGQVTGIYAAADAGEFTAELFMDATANVQSGAADSFLKAVRLMGV